MPFNLKGGQSSFPPAGSFPKYPAGAQAEASSPEPNPEQVQVAGTPPPAPPRCARAGSQNSRAGPQTQGLRAGVLRPTRPVNFSRHPHPRTGPPTLGFYLKGGIWGSAGFSLNLHFLRGPAGSLEGRLPSRWLKSTVGDARVRVYPPREGPRKAAPFTCQ